MANGLAHKVCPVCGQPTALEATTCSQCGHLYRTKFESTANATRMFGGQPALSHPAGQRANSPNTILWVVVAFLVAIVLLFAILLFASVAYWGALTPEERQELLEESRPPAPMAPAGGENSGGSDSRRADPGSIVTEDGDR